MPRDFTANLAYESQLELEKMFSKHQLLPTAREALANSGVTEMLKAAEIPESFGMDLLSQMMMLKRSPIQALVSMLWHHFKGEENPFQACADGIVKAVELDFLNSRFYGPEDKPILEIITIFTFDVPTQKVIDAYQYPLPMIVPPEPVKTNQNTGYMSIPGSIILKKNHHEDDVCLDHINRVNAIPLKLNTDVVAFLQNKWKRLDKRKPGESVADFMERRKAFHKFDESSRAVIKAILAAGEQFWLTHKYDKRGRVYCQGYHITYQGNDWCKACIEFAHEETLNDE